ncbi:MAG: 3-dehydroquinate synthase [Acidobacteriia bacterium]|nr:3-dehydroquinate synthase [Terriglobia bacterium]
MQRLHVTSQTIPYDILVGRGAWRALRKLAQSDYTSTFLLTERGLWNQWRRPFLRASGLKAARSLFVPSGEASKSLRMVERVAGELLKQGADRRSLIIAFGGGVIGDLGGFVASTYMRGIDCVQVPTTVVAQVDSAIGGKTAVNVGAMKNLIGTFFPPRLVVADPSVLSTLNERAFRSGFFEVVKHAVLSGPRLFAEVERALDGLRPERAATLGPLLARAARVKADVVSRDEKEAGLRRVLNLGHTFGHALEEATGYRRFLHGEAVGWGMLAALRLAEILGLLGPAESQRIAAVIRRLGPLPPVRDLKAERVWRLLPRDKKAVGGRIHWVLPERIGKVRIVADVPSFAVEAAFYDVQRADRHE